MVLAVVHVGITLRTVRRLPLALFPVARSSKRPHFAQSRVPRYAFPPISAPRSVVVTATLSRPDRFVPSNILTPRFAATPERYTPK